MHNGVAGIVYWIPVAAAIVTAAIQAMKKKTDRFTIPTVMAFLGTLAYHLYTGWIGFQKSGYPGGAQARYYHFLIIPFALILALNLPRKKAERQRLFLCSAVVILLVVLWLLGAVLQMLITCGFHVIA